MTYQEVLEQARTCMGKCHACPVCSGLTCKNMVPGPGAKGLGTGAIRNYQKWQELCVNMDTICENAEVDTSYDFFGHKLTIPVMAGPVGAVAMHYSDKYDDLSYNNVLVAGCAKAGIAAFTGRRDESRRNGGRCGRAEALRRLRRTHREAVEHGDHPAEDGYGQGGGPLRHRHGH